MLGTVAGTSLNNVQWVLAKKVLMKNWRWGKWILGPGCWLLKFLKNDFKKNLSGQGSNLGAGLKVFGDILSFTAIWMKLYE